MFGGRGNAIVIVTTVLLGIAFIVVCLRCYIRLRIIRSFEWDDSLMVVAMGFNVGLATCTILGVTYGMGRGSGYFQHRPGDFRKAMLSWWLGQIFYVLSCTIARLSITMMLLRFTVERVYRWALYAGMALSILIGIFFFFFTIFQCSPVAYYWERLTRSGTCLSWDTLLGIVYFYSAGAVACDMLIGLLPAILIRNLQLGRWPKVGLAVILGLGCVACAAVIVRIPFLHHLRDSDFLYATTQVSIWSNVEASIGITAGSLAHLRPLFRSIAEKSWCSRDKSEIQETWRTPNDIQGRRARALS